MALVVGKRAETDPHGLEPRAKGREIGGVGERGIGIGADDVTDVCSPLRLGSGPF